MTAGSGEGILRWLFVGVLGCPLVRRVLLARRSPGSLMASTG